ncbi:Transposase, IS5 family [Halomicrobium sp. LC1Hm]|nr:Transposase, IS5 family [Halomicrobium sp. LC1Hm]
MCRPRPPLFGTLAPRYTGGLRAALCNTDEIESLAGDKGYDDQSLRDALRAGGDRPVIRHWLFAHYDHAHNGRLDSDLYGQRWMTEAAFSAIKRRFGSAVGPSAWYREFRKLVLTVAVNNPEQTSSSDRYAVCGFNKAESTARHRETRSVVSRVRSVRPDAVRSTGQTATISV